MYKGKEQDEEPNKIIDIVKELTKYIIEDNKQSHNKFTLIVDNFYTSLELVEYMKEHGNELVGTLRVPRIRKVLRLY